MRKMLILALAFGLAACGGDNGNGSGADNAGAQGKGADGKGAETRQTIGDALAQTADHSSFVEALTAAGMAEALRGAGPYTVFAPTNEAFAGLPEAARRNLAEPAERERLTDLLSYHIVPGTVTVQDLAQAIDRGEGGRAELATVAGDNISISREGDAIVLTDAAGGSARVVRPDRIHANGVLHGIDAVLMPGE